MSKNLMDADRQDVLALLSGEGFILLATKRQSKIGGRYVVVWYDGVEGGSEKLVELLQTMWHCGPEPLLSGPTRTAGVS